MMTKPTNLILIISTLLILQLNAQPYSRKFQIKVPPNIVDIEYSFDQKYIILATPNSVLVYNGITNQQINTIALPSNGYSFSSMAFSQDSTKFAIGFKKDDGSSQYKIYNISSAGKIAEEIINSPTNAGFTGQITSLCYTGDNKRLVYGTSKGDIFVKNFVDGKQKTIKFKNQYPITSIVCSPYRSLQFIVAGNNKQENIAQMINYEIALDNDSDFIEQKHIYGVNITQGIRSLTYSSSGAFIYHCTTAGIYKTPVDSQNKTPLSFPSNLKNFRRIRVSKGQDVYAVSTDDKKLYLNKRAPSQQLSNFNQQQLLDIAIPTFGLAPSGINIFAVQDTQFAQVLSECTLTQYLDQNTLLCKDCDKTCGICFSQAINCYTCPQGAFLTVNRCNSCIQGCQKCSNADSCITCKSTFVLKNNICSCVKGTFLKEQTCATCAQNCLDCSNESICHECAPNYQINNGICTQIDKFPTWAVVLLVLLGISVIVVIAGILFIRMRKHKKSPLLSDSDEIADMVTND